MEQHKRAIDPKHAASINLLAFLRWLKMEGFNLNTANEDEMNAAITRFLAS